MATLTVEKSTFTGNDAFGSGAIDIVSGSAVDNSSPFAANSGGAGGTLTIQNSIVCSGTPGNCNGTITDGGFVSGGGWIDSQAGWCRFEAGCPRPARRGSIKVHSS